MNENMNISFIVVILGGQSDLNSYILYSFKPKTKTKLTIKFCLYGTPIESCGYICEQLEIYEVVDNLNTKS